MLKVGRGPPPPHPSPPLYFHPPSPPPGASRSATGFQRARAALDLDSGWLGECRWLGSGGWVQVAGWICIDIGWLAGVTAHLSLCREHLSPQGGAPKLGLNLQQQQQCGRQLTSR